MNNVITTKNLLISVVDLPTTDLHLAPRVGFLCRWKEKDQPEIIAHATLMIAMPSFKLNYLDWIEVNERDRRLGVGTELKEAIIEYCNDLNAYELSSEPVTDCGELFHKAFAKQH